MAAYPPPRFHRSPERTSTRLTHACIIGRDAAALGRFCEQVLRVSPQAYGPDSIEFRTEGGAVSLFSQAAQDRLAPGSTMAGSNRTILLEFEVADVDAQ